MAVSFDCFVLGARNFYETSARLFQETQLGFSTCEWRQSIARNVFPLGDNSYLSVEGMVDSHAFLAQPSPGYRYEVLAIDNGNEGDHWFDLSLQVDSLSELEAIATRLGGTAIPDTSSSAPDEYFRRPDGYVIGLHSAPHFGGGRPDKWPLGLPNFCYYPEVPKRSSSQPVVPRAHLLRPTGVKWIEFGGSAALFSAWLGVPDVSRVLPIRFNGKQLGLWAVCVGREGAQDVVIRRTTAAAAIEPSA